MPVHELQFGSLLAYCPRGEGSGIRRSREIMTFIKTDSFVENPPILMSEWIARAMEQQRTSLPFNSIFQSNTVLVPLPRSSLIQPESLWVPDRIAQALVRRGFGAKVLRCLVRKSAVRKSASSPAHQRPTPTEHLHSLEVQGNLDGTEEIVLVDDIITRGHTMMGAAWRLLEIFPRARISGFAAMRTISNPQSFSQIYDPRIGSIEYRQNTDDCIREP